jgi:hypothetical protein
MTEIDKDGSLIMDTDFAPKNSDVEFNKPNKLVTHFLIISGKGTLEDHSGLIIEETPGLFEILKEYPQITVIGRGESYVSLGELVYTLQSPTRQLYRATMADINEILKGRFEKDDKFLRNLCNGIVLRDIHKTDKEEEKSDNNEMKWEN